VFVIVQVSVCSALMVPVAEFDIGGRFCIQSPVKIGVANPVDEDDKSHLHSSSQSIQDHNSNQSTLSDL
jgi:hypothetical protein